MPSEKRTLEYNDSDRSAHHKRSRRDDQPRDWRAAHLDENKHKKHPDAHSRDRSVERDRIRDRDGPHRSRDDRHGSSSNRKGEKMPPTFVGESGELQKSSSFTRPPPTGPRAMVQTQSSAADDDEREEGEISPRFAAYAMMDTTDHPKPSEDLPELDIVEDKPVEDDAEARKARRAAILAKYQTIQTTLTHPGTGTGTVGPGPHSVAERAISRDGSIATPPPSTPFAIDTGAGPSPAADAQEDDQFLLTKDANEPKISPDITLDAHDQTEGGVEGVAAADYDPAQDMREDSRRAAKMANDAVMADGEESAYEEEEDMEDIDDMFAIDDDVEKKPKKKKKVVKKPVAVAPDTINVAADEEGYYQIILGEFLDSGRYQVFAMVGKGMFSIVVKARVFDPEGDKEKPIGEVAIKIVRSQESMYKAGLKEVQILQKLRQGDLEDKKHLVRLERTFEHRGHLCLVFESLSMNLRDTVKKYGRDVGLHIKAVRVYGHQLFLALSLMRKCTILHADIKPDNILINESRSNLKLCDLGSAADISYENTATAITPYLVSRFYRAPEIILGMPYDYAVDVWSVGCTLYELYTGRILFPGRSNREMLKLMMELKGKFNQKLVKKAKFGDIYFDDGGGFWEVVNGVGIDTNKKLHFVKPTRDLRARLLPNSSADEKEVTAFIDLLDKCLQLDPSRRITPKEALLHPFIRGS